MASDLLDRLQHAKHTARRARQPWVLIPCGAAKRTERNTAAELYTGQHFAMGLRAALELTSPERVLIVSARHGLVRLDDELDPYDQRIDSPGAITADELAAQLDRFDDSEPCCELTISLLPNSYQQVIDDAGLATAHLLAGCRGIGDQRAILAGITAAAHERNR